METTLVVPAKEVESINKQVMGFQDDANSLTLKSPADVAKAADLLETIKEAEKTVVGRKEEITRPLMRSLASVRDLFKPIEITLENAKKIVKAKVLAYQTLEEQKITDEKAKIEKRFRKGTMRIDTAIKKFGEIGTVTKSAGKMTTRTITKVRIVDETLIPREFLVPDMPKITEAVLRAGMEVAGVEKYQEKIIAA